MFSPLDFFDLTGSPHRRLFDELCYVWQALDRLPDYLAAHADWRILGELQTGAIVKGPVFIGKGTVVEPGALIIGPAIIGQECQIRHCAYLRGGVLLGDGCVVGHCSEVKSSILLDEAKAPHFNYVGDSILGNSVNLGAGTMCANLRLDGNEVFVRTGNSDDSRIGTGRRKLGAILGDGARTGCNVVLNPGALIPKGAVVPPGACVPGPAKPLCA
jgi:NDP-sugar pyrophosphorylase family protein